MAADPKADLERFCEAWTGETPYAVATVVRTERSSSAPAGSKAVVTASGELVGWIGGGCVRGAVVRTAAEVIRTGEPRLIRVKPSEEVAGDSEHGIELHKSGCPSRGISDIFVEPVLPKPRLVLFGGSHVAEALAALAGQAGFHVALVPPGGGPSADTEAGGAAGSGSYVVVATMGSGDFRALKAALDGPAAYVAFVGSRRKVAALKQKLREAGVADDRIDRIKGPAGLDIGAVDPGEIAVSILAEMIEVRRRGETAGAAGAEEAGRDV